MKWYKWETIEEFNNWHDSLCVQLGYPLTPVNQLTGEPDLDAQKVTRYCDAKEYDGVFIANVEDEHADGLIEIDYSPTLPDIFK